MWKTFDEATRESIFYLKKTNINHTRESNAMFATTKLHKLYA